MQEYSIILPVHNGGEYIKECIRSILSQSYQEFNLLILENCSSDGTSEWLQSLKDKRITIFPSDKLLSIEDNWARIKDIPKKKFITLIGHDDILFDDYLATMNKLIDRHPDAGLYQTHFDFINSDGKSIKDAKKVKETQSSVSFLENILTKKIDITGTGYMMRSADYDKIGGIPSYENLLFADFELWINLARLNYIATSPEKCFSFRLHQSMTTTSADIKYLQSFDRFIYFLKRLCDEDKALKQIINMKGDIFLNFYCQAISHRLLRTKFKKRNSLSVRDFVIKCSNYGTLLGVKQPFAPSKAFSVRLAMFLDSNRITRCIFLLFKRIYPKPILK